MSGLLSSPLSYDSSRIEGTVTNIDINRYCCTVRTVTGSYLDEVMWLSPTGGTGKSGVHACPSIGDFVVIDMGLTYPVILGCLPRVGLRTTSLSNMSGDPLGVDTGNATNILGGYSGNPDRPSDMAPGDYVITTEGGGIFAMMANGSTLIKASALAQIFLSRFDDVVRVVARNWERFSDVGQQTAANVKGRLYEYVGWDRSLNRSKTGLYELSDVIGDVAAGEVLKGDPNPATALPVADSRVRKYNLVNAAGASLMLETLTDDGTVVVTIGNAVTTHSNSLWQAVVGGTAKVIITPTNVVIDFGGSSTITVDSGKINAVKGSASLLLDGSSAKLAFGAHSISVTAGGIATV